MYGGCAPSLQLQRIFMLPPFKISKLKWCEIEVNEGENLLVYGRIYLVIQNVHIWNCDQNPENNRDHDDVNPNPCRCSHELRVQFGDLSALLIHICCHFGNLRIFASRFLQLNICVKNYERRNDCLILPAEVLLSHQEIPGIVCLLVPQLNFRTRHLCWPYSLKIKIDRKNNEGNAAQ